MERRWNQMEPDDVLDLDSLLHPAQAFDHPSAVVEDPDLTLNEKRAILASWASDACAIEAAPGLRLTQGEKAQLVLTTSWRHFAHSTSRRTNNNATVRLSAPKVLIVGG